MEKVKRHLLQVQVVHPALHSVSQLQPEYYESVAWILSYHL